MLKATCLGVLIVAVACTPEAAHSQPAAPNQANSASSAPGRGGVPNVTQQQAKALVRMNAELQPLAQALAAARAAVTAAALAEPRNDATLQARVADVRTAEVTLALARAAAFAKIQASQDRLSPDQAAAFAAMSSGAAGGGRGGIPNVSPQQTAALTEMTASLGRFTQELAAARRLLVEASLAPRDNAAIQSRADAVAAAELALARARADAFAGVQASPSRLAPEQATAFAAAGGVLGGRGGGGLNFTEPEPINFNSHEGYVSIFDGVSLKGWDGNGKFWRVENGAIVGESTPENPSGNTYLMYRALDAHDFTLKLEIKIEGSGGSGIQYRSKTGLPWLANVSLDVIANAGPTNLDWMATGPQADFWPTTQYSGQFYTENDPMRILAWVGEVVEGAGMGPKRLMGTIAERKALNGLIKRNDWNQYTIIARGGTFIHIINGQLMAVMVDDDPKSINNQPGQFGIELEAIGKISVRNIWLKKLN